MFSFEKISNQLTAPIAAALQMDDDHKEVLAYGAFAILQIAWSIFLIALFGIIFGVLLEALIISFAAAILRRSSGGAHATSPHRCAVIGMVVFGIIAILIQKLGFYMNTLAIIGYLSAAFGTAYYLVYKHAPVDTPNKPIKKEASLKRLKRASLKTLHSYLCIVCILMMLQLKLQNVNFYTIVLSLSTGMIWQCCTLTKWGHHIIFQLDALFEQMKLK